MKITLLIMAICSTLSATAIASPKTITSTLSCGPATVTATSTTDPHVPPNEDFAWLAQTLTLAGTPAHKLRPLQVDPKASMIVIGQQKALAAAVVSWACLTSTQGKTYLLLDVSCMRETKDGVCRSQKEWVRIIGTDGSHPDAAYAPQDRRYKALNKRLGISAESPADRHFLKRMLLRRRGLSIGQPDLFRDIRDHPADSCALQYPAPVYRSPNS